MNTRHPILRNSRRGLSLVEAILSTLLVAIVLTATMNLAGAAAKSGKALGDGAMAADLADGLMAEILNKAYADPTTPTNFGLESGETTSSKTNYNDVDDYNGWTQSNTFTGRNLASDGLVATVTVARATLATPSTDAASESGLKRIKVVVKRQNRVLATRYGWKADAP